MCSSIIMWTKGKEGAIMSLSISEESPVKISYNTAQDISDEILGGAIRFCKDADFKMNIKMLTFFWSAFLASSSEEICKHDLLEEVMQCYAYSLSGVFPKVLEDDTLRQKVNGTCRHYWQTISKDFLTLKTQDEISAFLQIARNLNNIDNKTSTLLQEADFQKAFVQVSTVIRSNVYKILRQIDNCMTIQYRGIVEQYRSERYTRKTHAQKREVRHQPQSVATKEKTNTSEPELGMAWYKFLIYFALFAGAVINLLYGINYISGEIYFVETNGEVSAEQVYAYYGNALQTIDIIYGIFLITFSIFAIVVRI